ncbi:hypothetical protein F4678DRAFT_416013 [Xylaria arbuscula]|nr:hypothetical protein F4678DRAFT_416013 [Xylaria arbuscula]
MDTHSAKVVSDGEEADDEASVLIGDAKDPQQGSTLDEGGVDENDIADGNANDNGSDNGAMTQTNGPDPSCSSNSTPGNWSEDDLVDAFLGLNLKAMFYDMIGNTKPINCRGYIRPHRSSIEIWEEVKRIHETFPFTPDEKKMPPADKPDLLDRHNKIVAAILTRYRNMVLAATEPLPTAGAIPQASLNAMTMNNEVSALIKEIQNLLALTHEIKQLWIVGPLRKPGDASEKSREKEIDEKAALVASLHNNLVELQNKNARKSAAQQAPPPAAEAKEGGDVHVKRESESHSS